MMKSAILVLLVAVFVAVDSAGLDKNCWFSKWSTTPNTNGPTRSQKKSPLRMAREINPNSNLQLTHGFIKQRWGCKRCPTSQPTSTTPPSIDEGRRSQRKSPLRITREIHHEGVNGFIKQRWGCKRCPTSQPTSTTPPSIDEGRRSQRKSPLRMTREIHHGGVNGFIKPPWGCKWCATSQPTSTTPQPSSDATQPIDEGRRCQRKSPPRMTREIYHEAVNDMDKVNRHHSKLTTMPPSSNSRIAQGFDPNSTFETAGSKGTKSPVPIQRILGGRKASLKEFPSMLSLWVRKDNVSSLTYLCGATLLNAQWALTAAHCLMDFDTSNVIVRAGSYNKGSKSSDHPAETFILHEQFTLSEGKNFFLKDDIALIKVSERFKLNNRTVKSARLPRAELTIPEGTSATAVGWEELGSTTSELLQAAELKIISKDSCADLWDKQSAKLVRRSIVCTQDSSKRFCGGTSGSPLFVKGEVVGIASAHLDVCVKTDLPGVHMDVIYYRDWIRKNTGI
ncbi:serine protease 42 isoform X2 [Anabrus simplex]|uniref:serine protease 42 isoform X2 n=1 Tax=Anabrus simplex TaxID=316456 RepID=UPI0035A32B3E